MQRNGARPAVGKGVGFEALCGTALLKQLQRNESMMSKEGTREAALQIFQEIYFLLFALTHDSLPSGSRPRLPEKK